jgi:hypothetical protein
MCVVCVTPEPLRYVPDLFCQCVICTLILLTASFLLQYFLGGCCKIPVFPLC